ncbi:hypothetical protein K7T73_13045 [Bacillus badius]|uniref:hypothetical protein n=1 Tax=Bacillus badius TaxID=1455 RepID=UPI001CBB5A31|nr:hypothetical protein [Bacillus badius]UAT29526.1 hypothetical protein K7T73_13045 [Bacillus badius]
MSPFEQWLYTFAKPVNPRMFGTMKFQSNDELRLLNKNLLCEVKNNESNKIVSSAKSAR